MKLNDVVKNFTLLNDKGENISLYDINTKYVVLYFYPKDSTSGCTLEALGYKDLYQEFVDNDVTILGISKDSVKSHVKFKEKYELPFTLLSDENLDLVTYFDIYKEKSMYGRKYMGVVRTTYVLNDKHEIIMLNEKVNTKTDAQEVLEFIKGLEA